ncbi:MAG: AMP-binding protein, partial [Deltaproteobacteria bacterium]|nr:AMP-binding protein [Deltaproteobacteria bacterium]
MNNIARFLPENVRSFGEYEQLRYFGKDRHTTLTNVQIEAQARALATGLRKRGIGRGDVVAVIVSNIAEIPELMNGVMRTGATYLPVIFALTPPEIRAILQDSGARLLITEEKVWPKVKEACAGLRSVGEIVVIGGAAGSGVTSYGEVTAHSDALGDVQEVDPEDLAILMYTAGTTGSPKGVMLSHGNLETCMRDASTVWPSNHDDRVLITVPMNHIYGVLFNTESIWLGASTVLLDWFNAEWVLELITELKLTIVPLVPTMITMMMAAFDPAKHSMASVRRMISAGAPLAEETLTRAQVLFGLQLYHGYGLTEAASTVARQREDRPFKYLSAGPPIPGLALKLLSDDGEEVPPGSEGEILIKGPGVTRGYWKKPEETAASITDGWLRTGDIGRFDEDGELYITGRKKDIIIRGGENIDPGVSENWLYRHPA